MHLAAPEAGHVWPRSEGNKAALEQEPPVSRHPAPTLANNGIDWVGPAWQHDVESRSDSNLMPAGQQPSDLPESSQGVAQPALPSNSSAWIESKRDANRQHQKRFREREKVNTKQLNLPS